MRHLAAVAIILLLAVAGSARAQTPEKLLAHTRSAELLGRSLYQSDHASALATDEMFRTGLAQRDQRVRGWVTVPRIDLDAWRVTFIGDVEGKPAGLYDVVIAFDRTGAPAIEAHDPPRVLSAPEVAMYRARTTALSQGRSTCSDRFNPVVLGPVFGPKTWAVYVLAATTRTGEMVVGGHTRVVISEDGTQVVSTTPLSKSCLRLEPSSNTAGAVVNHLLSPAPSEIHVFLSLLHKKPIFVGTSDGNWKVEGGAISFIGPR